MTGSSLRMDGGRRSPCDQPVGSCALRGRTPPVRFDAENVVAHLLISDPSSSGETHVAAYIHKLRAPACSGRHWKQLNKACIARASFVLRARLLHFGLGGFRQNTLEGAEFLLVQNG
jgi:hypothetical protein